ncbi:MAG: DUF3488 and transglutaminase-like domain-containing protein [Phycisphaerales bacterium]|nr:DUF3488 and transglutaminase-like domain-containing protein [Phycisphaerales bacterium]
MTIDRMFNWSSATLMLLSVVGAGVALDAPWLLLAGGMLVVIARLVTDGPRGRVIGRRMSLATTLAAALWGVWRIAMDPGDPLPAIVTFALCLAVIKCFENRTMENEAERIVLCFLLIALASMVSVEALFGLVFMLWAPLLCTVLLLFQVQYGRRTFGTREGSDQSGTPPPAGPMARRHLVNVIGVSLFLLVMLSAVVFIVFPRALTGNLALASAASIARTAAGTTNHLELVSGTRVLSSDAEVALVTQIAGNEPPGGVLRLRTGTMSEYTGRGEWHPSPLAEEEPITGVPMWRVFGSTEVEHPDEFRIELTEQLNWLPVPAGAYAIKTDRFTRIGWDEMRGVLSAPPHAAPERYDVRVAPGVIPATPFVETYWAWPDPDIRRLAENILTRAGLPTFGPASVRDREAWIKEAASAFVAHLRSGKYTYTLDLTRVGQDDTLQLSRDPVTRFLLEEPVGHCEYFAAGFTALAQAVGIPARIVTGFVAYDRDDQRRWVVRDRDAHAWSEVLINPEQWMAYDATPAAGPLFSGPSADRSILGQLQHIRSRLEIWWYGDVLGYDASAQRLLANTWLPGWRQSITDGWRTITHWRDRLDLAFGFGAAGTIWLMVVCGLGVVGVIVLWRRRVRRRALVRLLQLSDGVCAVADVAFYGELLHMLDRAGLTKPRHASPLQWCDTVEAARPAAAVSMQALVGVLYRRRFGHGDDTSADAIKHHLQGVAEGIAAGRPSA